MRLFIAVFPPKDVQCDLNRRLTSDSLLKKIAWGRPETYHITLKFIGQTKNDSIFKDVISAASSRHKGFRLRLEGGGGFPTLTRPRVLWTGLSGDMDSLTSVARDVEQECAGLGFPPENRRFSPHLTLARLEGLDSPTQAAFTAAMADFKSNPFPISELQLVQSQTAPTGATYTTLFSHPFSS